MDGGHCCKACEDKRITEVRHESEIRRLKEKLHRVRAVKQAYGRALAPEVARIMRREALMPFHLGDRWADEITSGLASAMNALAEQRREELRRYLGEK